MKSTGLPQQFHPRLNLGDYDKTLSGLDIRQMSALGEADSPNQVWSRERLRAEVDWAGIEQSPVDLLVWGKGPPPSPAGTKVGGLPAWPVGRPLPVEERNDWEIPAPLRFFGQVNFVDSLEILPELPGGVLSIWGTEDFPFEDSIRTFWLDPEDLELSLDYAPEFPWDFMPAVPFFAALHRSWDRSRRQELLDEASQQDGLELDSCVTSWMASKIGGQAARIQNEAGLEDARFFLQIKSIDPAMDFPHAWVSEPELLKIEGTSNPLHSHREGLNLADGGALYFFLNAFGSVEIVFESH